MSPARPSRSSLVVAGTTSGVMTKPSRWTRTCLSRRCVSQALRPDPHHRTMSLSEMTHHLPQQLQQNAICCWTLDCRSGSRRTSSTAAQHTARPTGSRPVSHGLRQHREADSAGPSPGPALASRCDRHTCPSSNCLTHRLRRPRDFRRGQTSAMGNLVRNRTYDRQCSTNCQAVSFV